MPPDKQSRPAGNGAAKTSGVESAVTPDGTRSLTDTTDAARGDDPPPVWPAARGSASGLLAAQGASHSRSDVARITTHLPGRCHAVCPVHGTDHRDRGGWVQVHTPLHWATTEPFRGRTCVTALEYQAWYAGVSEQELERRIRAEWTPGTDLVEFLTRIRAEASRS